MSRSIDSKIQDRGERIDILQVAISMMAYIEEDTDIWDFVKEVETFIKTGKVPKIGK